MQKLIVLQKAPERNVRSPAYEPQALSERAIELAKIREMKAVIAKKIADGEMTREEGDRIFKALTSDAPIAANDPPTSDLYEY